jgi:3-deoxy-7-phosphoheptulonate synthase
MCASLATIREQLDDVDQRIIDALADRQALVRQAAAHKTGGSVRVPERENEVLNRLSRDADAADLDRDFVVALYRTIFDHSVRTQRAVIEERPSSSKPNMDVAKTSRGDGHTSGHVNGHAQPGQVRNGHRPNRRTNGHHIQNGRSPSRRAAAQSHPPTPPACKPDDAPYALVTRDYQPEDTTICVGDAIIGGKAPILIGGPCSVESRKQIMACAEAVKTAGGHILRGGCFKPRTSPYSFQGLGFDGLDLLAEAGRTFDLPIITEVMHPADVPAVAEQSDILQIGARNMQNFELLKAAGRSHRPVMLKRGMMATIKEWLAAAEYVMAHGNAQVMLCQRGIRTFETATRFTLDLTALPVVRERTHLPIIVDPSHACGTRRWVAPLAEGALAAGADGLMVETHPNPDEALSDGPQSLTFDGLRDLAARIHHPVPVGSND